MLTSEDIDRLQSLDGEGAMVLSVYLDLDAARRVNRSYATALENLVEALREKLADEDRLCRG